MNLITIPDSPLALGPTLQRFLGPADAPILVVVSSPSWDHRPLSYAAEKFWFEIARQAGLAANQFQFAILPEVFPPGRNYHALSPFQHAQDVQSLGAHLALRRPKIIVPIDDDSLYAVAGHDSLAKWHLSIIPSIIPGLGDGTKVIPLLSPEHIFRAYSDLPFLVRGMTRLRDELQIKGLQHKRREYRIRPTFKEAMQYLREMYHAPQLGVDIETAHGQITCASFSPSATLAMSIPLEPRDWADPEQFQSLWRGIHYVMGGPSRKVGQNFVAFDATYFARYGISVANMWVDTMLLQKFLFPELSASLATIAQLWTREPYWKDEGRKWKPEDGLDQYYIYSCKDTAVMMEALVAMKAEAEGRGLWEPFQRLVMRMAPASTEMCWHGLPVDETERQRLHASYLAEAEKLTSEVNAHVEPLMGRLLNPRSPKQVKEYLEARRYKLPVKKGKETSDVTALLKLQIRYPNDPVLPLLVTLSEKNKAISSYLKVTPDPDGRIRFSRNLHGAMTGRRSCSKTPFDTGFNAQTLPSEFKSMIKAPPGWLFAELDLMQADARFVAWDAAEPTLMQMFREGIDIHSFVASQPELFNRPITRKDKAERQLGKKTGHAANYGMRGATHSEACLREMGLNLSIQKADQMLEGYHRIFPGIRIWHKRIQDEIRRTKRLSTPLGREWLIFGRLDDEAVYRQGYAYRPQSTVADIIDELIAHVHAQRNPENLIHVNEVHDSYICMVRESYLDTALAIMRATRDWNPTLNLSGGPLTIPVELKVGPTLASMEELHI